MMDIKINTNIYILSKLTYTTIKEGESDESFHSIPHRRWKFKN